MGSYQCQICTSEEYKHYCEKFDSSNRPNKSTSSFTYVQCCKCRTISLYPLPDRDILSHANENLYGLDIPASSFSLHFKPEYRETYFRELDLTFSDLNFRHNPGLLLDVGCGNGQFLDYMRAHGYETFGCDVSEQLTNLADKDLHSIYCEDFFTINYSPNSFEMISFIDTVEHVINPVDFIARISLLLKDNGVLFLQTPCQGVLSEAYGEDWRRLIPPDHLHLFSFDTLVKMLNRNNLALTSFVRWGGGNSMGTVPEAAKKASDTIAKNLGIGDEISLLAKKI